MGTDHNNSHKHTSSQDLVETLRAQGFRITKIRQAMLEIFVATTQPQSAQQLLATIAQEHPTVNKTTIYRELEFLVKNSIVTEIDILDGMKRYELHESDHHHHHLVCEGCKEIQCVEVPHHDLDALESRINKSHKFKVTSHVLEFFGLCKNCLS
jgi:Fur family ferric uptake transcriptional regulator